ncbi:MAG: hypothetical protein AAFP19_18745 [Bacteroidota bacterium]
MYRFFSILSLVAISLIYFSCADSASSEGSESGETVEQPTNTSPTEAARLDKEAFPGAKLLERLSESIILTEDQGKQLKALSAEYPLKGLNKEERKVKRKEFRQKVVNTILTEEQRATLAKVPKKKKKKNDDELKDQ